MIIFAAAVSVCNGQCPLNSRYAVAIYLCSLHLPLSMRFGYLYSKRDLKRQFLIYHGHSFATYKDKFSLVISDFILLLSYEKNVCYFNFTDIEWVHMEVKVCIFIDDISGKVNVMHENVFQITNMQIIVILYCMPDLAISL